MRQFQRTIWPIFIDMNRSHILFLLFLPAMLTSCKKTKNEPQNNGKCNVIQVSHNAHDPILYSPDSSMYLVNKKDTAGVYQIYMGVAGDTTLSCISQTGPFGILRTWDKRNKMQVKWHPSGNWIVCAVEKEWYPELVYTPAPLLEGWLQSGLWMDIWAVSPNGANWYNLATTEHGFTGPAFTPDGTKGVWAEALNGGNIFVDVFGVWKLQLSNFSVTAGVPSFSSTTNINPAGSRWIEPGDFSVDGKSLLVSSDIGMSNAEGQDQFIIDITNGSVVNLNKSPKIWDEHGVFSPDGKKVLFMSSYPYRSDTNSYHTLSLKTEFMLMNTDGSELQQLTHFRTPGYVESSPGIAATGFWNKEGNTIYAQSLIFPGYDNWLIKFQGNCGK